MLASSTGILLFVLLTILDEVMGVKREDFKRCDQSGFCYRSRERAAQRFEGTGVGEVEPWVVNEKSVVFNGGTGELSFKLQRKDLVLAAELEWLEDGKTMRLRVDEESSDFKRYRIPEGEVISKDIEGAADLWIEQRPDLPGHRVFAGAGLAVHLFLAPAFGLSVWKGDEKIVDLNGQGLFHVESEPLPSLPDDENGQRDSEEDLGLSDLSEEDEKVKKRSEVTSEIDRDVKWGKHRDSMPHGRQSLSLDIAFPSSRHLYGLPSHTTALNLPSTARLVPSHGGRHNLTFITEPYRLYNLDVFEYELDETMALYGSVPSVMSEEAGAFWNNPSETWVDLIETEELPDRKKGRTLVFSSESGIIDLFLFIGPPKDQLTRLAMTTGYPALPPLFSLGYHQCRWNYKSQQDLLTVHESFDLHRIPVDVLWLDIEHTDGKRYFTWDSDAFPDPVAMQRELEAKGRHLVNIVDPHIKADQEYRVYKELEERNLAVLSSAKQIFHGHCWPGDSVWTDFVDPEARAWWSSQFALSKYGGSTTSLHIWNDMNEPSVFSGPEITMPKDNLHMKGTVEHRDLHNLYGQLMHRATFEGLSKRNAESGGGRPFVLSRAFYAGSQKYGAVWTGDNQASWSHLQASIPMLLSLSLGGIPFVGVDVGGFFGNPEPELLVRWYQTGALSPFFRAHAHIETKRREPWLFDEPYLGHIRDAINLRYQLLPYIYTLFYEASITGIPMMRPMFLEFNGALPDLDDQFMLGPALLHKPVTQAQDHSISVAFPPETSWYDFATLSPVLLDPFGPKTQIDVDLETIPLFIRAGSILPLKLRQRRSSKAMAGDPFTILVALDSKQAANGTVYIDDGTSYAHELGAAHYMKLTYAEDRLSCRPMDSYSLGPKHLPKSVSTAVEAIVMTGFKRLPRKAYLEAGRKQYLPIEIDEGAGILRFRMPPVSLANHWTINFE